MEWEFIPTQQSLLIWNICTICWTHSSIYEFQINLSHIEKNNNEKLPSKIFTSFAFFFKTIRDGPIWFFASFNDEVKRFTEVYILSNAEDTVLISLRSPKKDIQISNNNMQK